MDQEYRDRYATLYRRHWWWRAREWYLTRQLDRVVGAGGAGDILDFGCGDGLFFPVLERYGRPFGVETDTGLLSPENKWRDRITSQWTDGDPAEAGRYGLIVALDVLEHIENPHPVAAEFRRRLRPDGLCLITVPAFQSMWTRHDDVNQHVHRHTQREMESMLRGSGFEIVDARYFFVWVGVAKWFLARLQSLVPGRAKPPSLPWAPVNAIVRGISLLEMRVLGRLRPAFGSSLLVLARARVE